MTEPRHLRLAWGGATDQGRVRAANQDAMFADRGLFVVADGMGGHQGGEVAANLAVRTLAAQPHETCPELRDAVTAANQVVHDTSIARPDLHGMGTTLTAIAVVNDDSGPHFGLVNVGDSRIYRQRDGVLHQLTYDHSYVAELMRRGDINAEEAANHPYRNMLTRAIGVNSEVEIDEWEVEPEAGDRYLLCSDGLTNEVTDDEINAVLNKNPDVSEAARALVQLANLNGGRDNSTVLIVNVQIDGDQADAAPGESTVADTDEIDTVAPLPGLGAADHDGDISLATEEALDDSSETPDLQSVSPLLAHLSQTSEAGSSDSDMATGGVLASDVEQPETRIGDDTEPLDIIDMPVAPPIEPEPILDLEAEPVFEPEPELEVDITDGGLDEEQLAAIASGEPEPSIEASVAEAVEVDEGEAPVAVVDDAVDEIAHDDPTEELTFFDHAEQDLEAATDVHPVGGDEHPNWMRQTVPITMRAVLAPVIVIVIAVAAISVVGWYARGGFHVGTLGDEVVVFKGRQGGVLWFNPTLESRPGLLLIELTDEDRALVEGGQEAESLEGAELFIADLRTRTTVPDDPDAASTDDDADS